MSDRIEYITPAMISFSENEAGLICATFNGENVGRVAVLRMFPFDYTEEYLCVRNESFRRSDKENEIGIIRKLSDFEQNQIDIVRKELDKRYFIPDIIKVNEVKDEFGHTRWNTVTTAGEREFTVTDMSSNVINLGNNKVMLVDVYGNRYYFQDITKTDDKTMKVLEIWI